MQPRFFAEHDVIGKGAVGVTGNFLFVLDVAEMVACISDNLLLPGGESGSQDRDIPHFVAE